MIKAYFITSKHSDWIATFDNEDVYNVCWPQLEKLAKKHRMELYESSEMDDREEFFEWLENCPVDYNVDQTDDDGEDEIKVIGFVVPKEGKYRELINVKIAWGSDRDENNIEDYWFNTKEEYYAFMKGVEASNGWMAYDTIGDGETFETVEEWRKYHGKE